MNLTQQLHDHYQKTNIYQTLDNLSHENGEIHRFNLNLYVGGTSITKGGGFEPLSARQDIRPKYKEKYGDIHLNKNLLVISIVGYQT